MCEKFNIVVDHYANDLGNTCIRAANLLRGKSPNKDDMAERYTKCNLKDTLREVEFNYICNSRTFYEDMIIRCLQKSVRGRNKQIIKLDR